MSGIPNQGVAFPETPAPVPFSSRPRHTRQIGYGGVICGFMRHTWDGYLGLPRSPRRGAFGRPSLLSKATATSQRPPWRSRTAGWIRRTQPAAIEPDRRCKAARGTGRRLLPTWFLAKECLLLGPACPTAVSGVPLRCSHEKLEAPGRATESPSTCAEGSAKAAFVTGARNETRPSRAHIIGPGHATG